jgi:hypothetical protein
MANGTAAAPVSIERVRDCLKSARFWVWELPRYADRQQRLADGWAIAAGVLASATGLSIFPVVTADSTWEQKILVSVAGLAAAICALIPRVTNYSELAGQARELTSRYGGIVGDLLDLSKAEPFTSVVDAALPVVTEFEAIKAKKDNLRGLPDRDAIELKWAETATRQAAAELRQIQAENALRAERATGAPGSTT